MIQSSILYSPKLLLCALWNLQWKSFVCFTLLSCLNVLSSDETISLKSPGAMALIPLTSHVENLRTCSRRYMFSAIFKPLSQQDLSSKKNPNFQSSWHLTIPLTFLSCGPGYTSFIYKLVLSQYTSKSPEGTVCIPVKKYLTQASQTNLMKDREIRNWDTDFWSLISLNLIS